ncbi:MAG: hypothetical protein ACRD29_03395, partial [Acidimicrobiales bacterium]
MFDAGVLGEVERLTDLVVTGFDPALVSGVDAEGLVERFSRLEKQYAAAKLLAARRATECNTPAHHGDKTPARWLARTTGAPVGQAAADLEAAERLADLPHTEAAARDGRLSAGQLREITAAASADPSAEDTLLGAAGREGFGELRDRCRRTRAAADADEDARHQRIHRERFLRTWNDHDGAGNLHWRGTTDNLAAILGGLEPHRRAVFDQARRDGRREPAEAYLADAL